MKRKLLLLLILLGSIITARSQVTAAEYFFDTDPGVGNGTAIGVTPGDIVNINTSISTLGLGTGFHFLAIRVRNSIGQWSLLEKRGIYISASTSNTTNIEAAEYFFDTDPGHGNGTSVSVGSPGATINFSAVIPVGLSAGFHFLTFRVKNQDGQWSLFENRGFYISGSTANTPDIIAAEYFFDADPGVGNGTPMPVGASGATVNFSAVIPTALSAGFHFLAIRTKNAEGKWGLYEQRGFYISSASANVSDIVAAEYFFDSDPGIGNGTSVPVGPPGAAVNFTAAIPASLSPGFHFLAIRTKNAEGKWGLYEQRGFYISSTTGNTTDIVAAEYFFNTDPGTGNAVALTVTTPGSVVNQTFSVPAIGLPEGAHTLAIRVKNTEGKWGLYDYQTFSIGASTITCPANQTVNTGVGECSTVVNNIDPLITPAQPYTYTISGATTANGSGSASGQAFNAGVNTVTYVLTGSPSVSCSFTVTVNAAAPTISTQPSSQSVCIGANVTFTVVANGANLSYQWRKGGVNISGATGSSYTINGVAEGDAGNYDVMISTGCVTSILSETAGLAVGAASINTQPASQAVCPGANVTFSVDATGSSLTYQWRKGGANITGATSSSYTISGAAATDEGNYDVVITSSCGNLTSNVATLTVNIPPQITVPPTSETLCEGLDVTFTVTATGTGLSYQWRKTGANIGGATGSSYTINSVTVADAGSYDVVVTGVCPASLTSNPVTLTVNTPPAISTQPSSQIVCAGTGVTFSVSGTGTGLIYQWRKGGTAINAAILPSLSINSVTAADAGNYDVVITGTCGTLISNSVSLTVNPVTQITADPSDVTLCAGGDVTFTVTATGTGLLAYQWKKNGVDIGGATSSSYTINGAAAGDEANYSVVVSGTCGTATSANAGLTVNGVTAIGTQPPDQSSCLGGSVTFTVIASGTGPFSYQWKRNGVDIIGANMASYSINSITAGDEATYSVVITGACGSATSSGATLTVTSNTVINTQPVSQSSCPGSSVTFSASASGSGSLSYQWKKNGVNIPGATASTYTINPVTAGDAADYTVQATSSCGTIMSNAATLTILPTTSIDTHPTHQSVCSGADATFTVNASGDNLSYQWRKDGVNIAAATASSYLITGVSASDAANYDVVVSGTCGNVISGIASLTLGDVVIQTDPLSQTACEGTNVTFSVTATGNGLNYQWRKDGSTIPGAMSSSYTITGVTGGAAGTYDVIVGGTCGALISNPATLSVNSLPAVTVHPVSQSVCLGGDVSFSVTATGTGITYQWRKEGVNIPGATGSLYSITGAGAVDAGSYDVVVSGACTPPVTSNIAVLTVNQPPLITTQPASQASFVGSGVTFTVVANGGGLTYQWRKDGVDIAGATSSSYTINPVALADAGDYSVVVSGACSPATTSSTAVLTVSTVSITTQPASQSVCVGANATFNVVANGSNLTYQWQVSAAGGSFTNIAGATNSSLALNAVTLSMSGNQYRVVVSGSLNSNIAILTVNPLPTVSLTLPFDTLYMNSPLQVLAGGSPAGGVYSGTGIGGTGFLPGALPIGNYVVTYRYTNANGCTSSATDQFTMIPSVDKLNLFPVPAPDGRITMLVSADLLGANVVAYNSMGQKIKEWIVPGRYSAYHLPWAAGLYVIKVSKGPFITMKQIVIVR